MHKPIKPIKKKNAPAADNSESVSKQISEQDLVDLNGSIPPRPDVSLSLEYCSPIDVSKWFSGHNRRLIPSHAAAIERDMQAGRFQFTGVPIIFAKTERGKEVVIDGDHRKVGVINIRRGQWFIMVRGVSPTAQEHIDINSRPRHVRDLLSLHRPPIDPAAILGAAGSYLACWKFYGWFQGYAASSRPTPKQIYDLILATPRLQELAQQYSRTREPGSLPPSILIALHYILDAIDQEQAKVFMYSLHTGDNVHSKSPIWSMRRWISRNRDKKGAEYLRQAGDAVLWLWSRVRAGEKVTSIHVPKSPFADQLS